MTTLVISQLLEAQPSQPTFCATVFVDGTEQYHLKLIKATLK